MKIYLLNALLFLSSPVFAQEKQPQFPPKLLDEGCQTADVVFKAIERHMNGLPVSYNVYKIEGIPDDQVREILHFFLKNGLPESMREKLCAKRHFDAWEALENRRVAIEKSEIKSNFDRKDSFFFPTTPEEERSYREKKQELNDKLAKVKKRPLDRSKLPDCIFDKDPAWLDKALRNECVAHYLRVHGDKSTLQVLRPLIMKIGTGQLPEDFVKLSNLMYLYFELNGRKLDDFLRKAGLNRQLSFPLRNSLYRRLKGYYKASYIPEIYGEPKSAKPTPELARSYLEYMREVVKRRELFPPSPEYAPDYAREYQEYLWFTRHPNQKWQWSMETTPLMKAIKGGHIDQVKQLLKDGADVNERGWNGEFPLLYAIDYAFPELVPLLVSHGADVNKKTPPSGYAVLHAAVSADDVQTVKYLLENGAKVNIKTTDGVTPLDLAVGYKDNELINLLRQYGGKENNKTWKAPEERFRKLERERLLRERRKKKQ